MLTVGVQTGPRAYAGLVRDLTAWSASDDERELVGSGA
jgi:hypothetical protein